MDGALELHFCAGPEGRLSLATPAPTPAVPVTLEDDPVTRANSPLELDECDDDDTDDSDGTGKPFRLLSDHVRC